MNMGKNLMALLAVSLLGVSSMIQSINPPVDEMLVEQSEVPLLSPKQLSKQMNDFRRYLNRVRRCMFTGPCTKEEIAQVRHHAWRLLKAMGWLGVAAALYYGAPILKQKTVAGAKALGKQAAAGAVGYLQEPVMEGLAEGEKPPTRVGKLAAEVTGKATEAATGAAVKKLKSLRGPFGRPLISEEESPTEEAGPEPGSWGEAFGDILMKVPSGRL